MTALEIILILAVLVLAAVLFVTMRARRHDRSAVADQRQRMTEATARAERSEADRHHVRADTTEQLAQERVARERAQAELHEARLRIVALEQRRDALEADAGETASRPGLFSRSRSEIPPEDTEQERSEATRGS